MDLTLESISKTPYEMCQVNLQITQIFGFVVVNVYYHVNEGKLELRATKGVFVGYGDRAKGYSIWSPYGYAE